MGLMSTANGSQIRRALVNGIECALAYGALANILTLVLPALVRPVRADLPHALLSQLLLVAVVVPAALALAVALQGVARISRVGVSRFSVALIESAGALSLGIAALALAWASRQGVLAACSVLAIVLATIPGFRSRPHEAPSRQQHRDCWTTALLLIVVPFLTEVRTNRNWGQLEAAAAGTLVAGLITIAAIRQGRLSGARLSPAVASVWLALASAVGLLGAQVLEEKPDLKPTVTAAGPVSVGAPNVILIVLDTVRADHTSLYGYGRDTTPTLRSMWQSGATLYTRAIATSDWTLPSTASIMTGLLATHHGVMIRGVSGPFAIPPSATTLAEHLHRAGFRTYGIAANSSLDSRLGFGRGFDYYQARPQSTWVASMKPYLLTAGVWRWLPLEWRLPHRSAEDITREAVRGLPDTRRADATPFFLFLNYMDAHDPYFPPDDYKRKYGAPRPPFSMSAYVTLRTECMAGTRHVSSEERQDLEADYDAGIAYIDDNLRELFDELRQRGLFDSSMIIVTSDHGEMFGESDIVGHALGLFPELVHVPLLVKYPSQRQTETVDHTVSGADILPTVLAAVGLQAVSSLDGSDLSGGTSSDDHVAISESFDNRWFAQLNPRFRGDERAAFIGPVVHRIERGGTAVIQAWHDGAEMPSPQALLRPRPDVMSRLQALSEASKRLTVMPAIAPDLLDRLRALGYLAR
jgi:arylsulfatase A-like enzyme